MDDFVHGICDRNTKMYHDTGNTSAINDENELISIVNQDYIYTEAMDFLKDMRPNGLCAKSNGSAPLHQPESARHAATNLKVAG